MFLILLISFFPCVLSGNSTTHELLLPNKTNSENKLLNKNVSKLTLASEGGSITTQLPLLNLSNANNSALLSLDRELGKSKEKPSVPRKGANFNESETFTQTPLITHATRNNTLNTTALHKTAKINNITSVNLNPSKGHKKIIESKIINAINNKTEKNDTATSKVMKPTILSYNELLKFVNNESKAVVIDKGKEGKIISNKARNTTSHPEMVMPLVITILVVPVFAILGYMALRRGRDAWKNRHYKRMDFLLDGMYNE